MQKLPNQTEKEPSHRVFAELVNKFYYHRSRKDQKDLCKKRLDVVCQHSDEGGIMSRLSSGKSVRGRGQGASTAYPLRISSASGKVIK